MKIFGFAIGFGVVFGTFSAPAGAQRIIALGTESARHGRLILSTSIASTFASCPRTTGQFSLDDERDVEWSQANRARWDEDQIVSTVRTAVAKAQAAFPSAPVDICLGIAGPPGEDPTLGLMGGIGGGAFPSNVIGLYVAPSLNADWLDELSFTIAHEYHHVATARPARDGLAVLLREGKAHHFAAAQYPEFLHASARALSAEQVGPAWVKIRQNLEGNPRRFLRAYMFGGPFFGNEVPRWAGYTVGYCLAAMYANAHPELSLRELDRVPLGEFIADDVQCPVYR